MRRATSMVAVAAAVLSHACVHAPPPPSSSSPLLASPVPDVRRTALDGRAVDLRARGGRALVVKFFAKYCAPCMRTLPEAQRLAARRTDVDFVGVALDDDETDVRALIALFALTFPVVHDRARAVAGRFRVVDLPMTFVVDDAGAVRWVGGPEQGEHALAAALAAYR